MAREPARFRPKIYPPPEFPPRRVPLFSRTPPAIFPPILGLLGLVAAMRLGIGKLGLAPGIGDLATGLVLPLWGFAMCIYIAKMIRRISVIEDDLKVMPARAGLAAGADGVMVEVHPDPLHALCDGSQSLSPAEFAALAGTLRALHDVMARDRETVS